MRPPSGGGANPYRTLLFDLDGTLLDISMPRFLEAYFPLAARRFGAAGDIPRFRDLLYRTVRLMMHNRDPGLLLADIFFGSFAPKVGMTPAAAEEVFRSFNRNEFESLRAISRPFPSARPLLERALDLGYDLVLATNPVFLIEAIERRTAWAGLEAIPFRFVSSADNMHFCKPHPEYYLEVVRAAGRTAGECVMIGNDPAKDLPARNIGVTTYYVASPGERRSTERADHRGDLESVRPWLEGLGPVAAGAAD